MKDAENILIDFLRNFENVRHVRFLYAIMIPWSQRAEDRTKQKDYWLWIIHSVEKGAFGITAESVFFFWKGAAICRTDAQRSWQE